MREFRHLKYGLISGLILLVSAFPIYALVPFVGLVWVLDECFFDCEPAYTYASLLSLLLAIIVGILYLCRVVRKNISETFGFALCFNLLLFSLINGFVFVVFVGTQAACHGDGQVILGAIFSGLISIIVVVLNGLLIDVVKHYCSKKKAQPASEADKINRPEL